MKGCYKCCQIEEGSSDQLSQCQCLGEIGLQCLQIIVKIGAIVCWNASCKEIDNQFCIM